MHFQREHMHKFTWVSGLGVNKNLLELILVQEEDRNKFLDVNVYKCWGEEFWTTLERW